MRSMNATCRFFLKCILALLPLAAVVSYTLLCPFGYMDEEYPSWRYTKMVQEGREKSVPDGTDTLILGDSRAMADIMPTLMGDGYVNLGIGGATSVEMYYTLKHYIENNGAPENVYIMFAPFHYSYMDNYRTRTMYFKHLSFTEAMDVYTQGVRVGAAAFEDLDRSDIISMYAGLPDSYLPALINSRFVTRSLSNRSLYASLVRERGYGPYGEEDGSSDLNYESNYTKMERDGEHTLITVYFEKLLKLCTDNGIKTILLQAPMNTASYERLDPSYVREYTRYMQQIGNDNPDVVFEYEIPCYGNEYFGDSSHLNRKGARKYTEEIIDKYVKPKR